MATHKYSTSTKSEFISPTLRWESKDNPHLTKHALERWDQRTPATAASPEFAVERRIEAPAIEDHPHFQLRNGRSPKAISVYAGRTTDDIIYQMVFVEVRDSIVTTYPISLVENGAVKAYLDSIAGGPVDE